MLEHPGAPGRQQLPEPQYAQVPPAVPHAQAHGRPVLAGSSARHTGEDSAWRRMYTRSSADDPPAPVRAKRMLSCLSPLPASKMVTLGSALAPHGSPEAGEIAQGGAGFSVSGVMRQVWEGTSTLAGPEDHVPEVFLEVQAAGAELLRSRQPEAKGCAVGPRVLEREGKLR